MSQTTSVILVNNQIETNGLFPAWMSLGDFSFYILVRHTKLMGVSNQKSSIFVGSVHRYRYGYGLVYGLWI
jgi:hypothetical protein